MMIRDSFPSRSMDFLLASKEEADELGWESQGSVVGNEERRMRYGSERHTSGSFSVR
jgi:hypothetical protein